MTAHDDDDDDDDDDELSQTAAAVVVHSVLLRIQLYRTYPHPRPRQLS